MCIAIMVIVIRETIIIGCLIANYLHLRIICIKFAADNERHDGQ